MRRYHIQDREDYHKCVPQSSPHRRPASSPDATPLSNQVQQALRLALLLRAQTLAPPGAGPFQGAHGRPGAVEALRHGRPQRQREDERRREQAHRRCVLSAQAGRGDVRGADGGDGQRGAFCLFCGDMSRTFVLCFCAFMCVCVCVFFFLFLVHARRLSSLSNKGTSESGLILSLTLHTLLPGKPTHTRSLHVCVFVDDL